MKNNFILSLALVFISTLSIHAQVTTGEDDGTPGTLRSQIAAAAAGAVINIAPSVTDIVLVSGEIIIDKSITLNGLSLNPTGINADAASRIFNITAGTVRLNHLALENGNAPNGGAIIVANALLQIDGCTISDCTASATDGRGGAIYAILSADIAIASSTFSGNTANHLGGAIEAEPGSGIMLTAVDFIDNHVAIAPGFPFTGQGGAMHGTGNAAYTVTGGNFNDNTASNQGGAIWTDTGNLTLNQVSFQGNSASGDSIGGGGGAVYFSAGIFNSSGCTLKNNAANGLNGAGGALFLAGGSVTMDTCVIDQNTANRSGGGIEIAGGQITLNAGTLTNNDVNGGAGIPNPGNGGGIHISGSLSGEDLIQFSDLTISGNNAANAGGGIWSDSLSLSIGTMSLDNNSALVGGGVYQASGSLYIEQSTISNNSADAGPGNGGGLYVAGGNAILLSSTVSGNTAAANGGGIYSSAMLNLVAMTVTNNTALSSGGGIANGSVTGAMLKNSIIANNDAPSGVDLSNSGAAYVSGGYNLIGFDDNDVFLPATGDIQNEDALLGPLADNGGPTMTHALLIGSLAYNAGDPADMFNDQRNLPVFAGIRDIGAFESQTVLSKDAFEVSATSGIYPNPASEIININLDAEFGEVIKGSLIEIATGKTVRKFTGQSTQLHVADLASGVYVLKLTSHRSSQTKKIIIN